MTWEKYRVEDAVLKATEDLRLWQAEKGIVEIKKDSLAAPVMLGDDRKGYVFHGEGKLLLDTIIETEKGALGKSVERDLNRPFLMLGDTKWLEKRLTAANTKDFANIGIEDQQRFIQEARDMLDWFFMGRVGCCCDFDADQGFVFAFSDETRSLDVLLIRDSKLVYKAKDMTFVSNGNGAILRNPSEVIIANNEKLIVVQNGKSLVMKKCGPP